MKYPRILAALRSAKWAVAPATLQAVVDTLGAHLRGHLATLPARAPSAAAAESLPSSLAVIPIHGVIGKRLSSLETECGGCDVDAVSAALAAAVADPAVSAILLDIDSPGGVVTGVPELAEKIRTLDRQKPVVAFSSGQCCSAAYWIASAARTVVCTPTADLGSIGVYIALIDDTEWWHKQGYKLELIKAGDFKAMGISGKSLSDAERALLQADVDAIYATFTADVRLGRGAVSASVMQGQTFMGDSAVKAGLADMLAPDLGTLVDLLMGAEPGAYAARVATPARAALPGKKPDEPAAITPPPPALTGGQPLTFNISLPQMNFAAPNVSVTPNIHVDARLEKDSVRVEQTQTTGGAKKITTDAAGNITGLEPASA